MAVELAIMNWPCSHLAGDVVGKSRILSGVCLNYEETPVPPMHWLRELIVGVAAGEYRGLLVLKVLGESSSLPA